MARLECGCRHHPKFVPFHGYDLLPITMDRECPGPICGKHWNDGRKARVYELVNPVFSFKGSDALRTLAECTRGGEVWACDDCAAQLGDLIREAP